MSQQLLRFYRYLPLISVVIFNSLHNSVVQAQTVATEQSSLLSLDQGLARSNSANLATNPSLHLPISLPAYQSSVANIKQFELTSEAFLPEQDISKELLKLEIGSDSFAATQVSDTEQLPTESIREHLGQAVEASPINLTTPLQEQASATKELLAQTPPPQDIIPPTTPEPAIPTPLPPPEELLHSPTTPIQPEALPNNVSGKITVERFEFIGSSVFSQEQLATVTAPFVGRPLSFSELLQARSAITQLYIDNGYLTSGAYIPPQELEGGTVKIAIIEGSLEEINVRGLKRLRPGYIRNRLQLAAKAPLNVPDLLEALQLLQLNPLIDTLSAELSAGVRTGTSILDVEIKEAQSFNIEAKLDNGRSPSVGSFRREAQLSEANLLGFGDGFSVSYTNTNGSNDFDFAYTFPLNARNGTLQLGYTTTSSAVIESPFDDLDGDGEGGDIESEARSYSVTMRQPLSQSPRQEFAIGLTFDHQQSETSLLEIPFPLSPGADDQGRTRISALRLFQEWTNRNQEQVLAARSEFSFGIGAFDATINNGDTPDSNFFSWRGQAQWVRLLAPDTLLVARTDVQLADRPLVPLEQFALGGFNSVRGYRQDVLLTDSGWLTSVELRLPILHARRINGVLHIIPFFDFGVAWNSSGNPDPDPNTIASLGLGLQWQQGDRLTARLDWGIPLVNIDSRGDTLQEDGILFSIYYKLF